MQGVRRKYQKNLQGRGWAGNDAFKEFGGGKNAGDAGSGVGSRPAKKKAANVLGYIVGAEPSTLGEDRFELKSGTDVGIKAGFEISGGKDELADKMFAQIGDDGFL